MTLNKYNNLLEVIKKYRDKELPFSELASWMRGSGSSVGYELDYAGDFGNHMDAWLELIEFCYREDERYELSLSVCDFIENAILNEPRPLELPKTDRVLKEQGIVKDNK